MDVQALTDLLDAWLRSTPSVRGHVVDDAEIRIRADGGGRLAVALRPKDAGVLLRDTAAKLAEVKAASDERGEGRAVDAPVPLGTPVRAFAHFENPDDLEQILGAVRQAEFYFDDERADDGNPLWDR